MQVHPYLPAVAAILCFRGTSGRPGRPNAKGLPEERPIDVGWDPREAILCRQCRQMVTHASERISVRGGHQHTFANPHGIVFEIGCFRTVQGCGLVGQATLEWSWFKGYSWRILVCKMCLTHLGWLFASTEGESFSGLILDRIIASSEVRDDRD